MAVLTGLIDHTLNSGAEVEVSDSTSTYLLFYQSAANSKSALTLTDLKVTVVAISHTAVQKDTYGPSTGA